MNLAAMRARVRRPFRWDEDDAMCTLLVDDAINDAYDLVNSRRAWAALKATDVDETIEDTDDTLDVPTDWLAFESVFIINASGAAKHLPFITRAQCAATLGDPSTMPRGTPSNYTLYGDTDGSLGSRKVVMEFIPHPSATFTVRRNGVYRPARLTAATQVPWFQETFHAILPMYAIGLLGLTEAGWDRDKADRFMQRALDQLDSMVMFDPCGDDPLNVIPIVGE